MSPGRILIMVGRDLRLSPRSPVILFALFMPVTLTFLVQVVFATLFNPSPRLALYDRGDSAIAAKLKKHDGIKLTRAGSEAELKRLVRQHDVDAGLILAKGFDEAVRDGKRPTLQLYVSGESLAFNRGVLASTVVDLVRQVEGRAAPIEVTISTRGSALPVPELIQLFLVLFVILVAGLFAPSFALVEEREQGTLSALLVTPTRMSEILAAKAIGGLLIALPMAYLTLALNRVHADPLALLATLFVAALICIEIGLIYGCVAKDAKALYTLVKSLNIFIIGPTIFYFFPNWPQWIAKIFPTYWFIDPLHDIALEGATLADIASSLLIALGVAALLLLPIVLLSRRLETQLAST